jgi:hypothetical protein
VRWRRRGGCDALSSCSKMGFCAQSTS